MTLCEYIGQGQEISVGARVLNNVVLVTIVTSKSDQNYLTESNDQVSELTSDE